MERSTVVTPAPARRPQPPARLRDEAALEHDAERQAAQATGLPRATEAPLAVNSAAPPRAGTGGQPLPPALRQRFEPHFGVDFGAVRIHDDAAAHALTRAAQAQASTLGHHIHFAVGRWQPQSRAGTELLAHELAHVAQAEAGAPAAWHNKPDPNAAPVAKWYQEAIDNVAYSRQRMAEMAKQGGLVITPGFFDIELALLELCEAVEAGDKTAAPKKLEALMKVGFGIAQSQFSRELMVELAARLYELGLEAESTRLREAYAKFEKIGKHDPDMYGQRRRLQFVERLIQGAGGGGFDSAERAGKSLQRYARSYAALRAEWVQIDFAGVADDRRWGSRGFALRPMMTRLEYAEAMEALIRRWHTAWSTFMQQAIDAARADLEKAKPDGSGAALLGALRSAMVNVLQPVINLDVGQTDPLNAESIAITKTDLPRAGQGQVVDVFDSAAGKARPKSVPVTTYDPKQEGVPELRSSIVNSYDTRLAQIHTLGRLYGVLDALQPKKKFLDTLADAEAAVDTRESVQAAGGLKLDNDDSWRAFLLQKYKDLTAASPPEGRRVRQQMSPGDALKEIFSLLFGYFSSFTVHARYTNLYDVGVTPYFNRPFPRALTGQLVQDCGVYALRAAYMLSLVRNELGLRFFFVRLPAHVSLVVTGAEGSELPTFLVENNHYRVLEAGFLQRRRAAWQKFTDPDTDQPLPGPADDKQFLGELAATDFIGGPLDMPMRVTELPKALPGKGAAKAEQAQLWAFYQGAALSDVFGPASSDKNSPNHLFHQRYLALTEEARQIHNDTIVPFWNQAAPATWDQFVAALEGRGADAKAAARTELDCGSLGKLLEAYETALIDASEALFTRMQGYEAQERKLSERLQNDPKLKKSGVRISAGLRASTLLLRPWQWYSNDLSDYIFEIQGRAPAEKETVDEAKRRAEPPWVPVPDNSTRELD